MQRILLAIGGAAVFSAIATLLLQLAIMRGLPVDQLVLITAIATLVLAVTATFLSYRALKRSNEMALEIERLSRSMDAAIKDVSARGDRDAAVFGDLSAAVSRKLDALSAQVEHAPEAGGNGSSRAGAKEKAAKGAKQTRQADEGPELLDRTGVEVALRRAASGEQADLSLQPIIAAGRGAAGGFEVYFHIQPDDGAPIDIRRLTRPLPDFDTAAFERLAVVSATEAARKRPREINEKTPLHVAISEALLQDGLEFATVLDIFRLHPALARSIVLSVPAGVAESSELSAPLEILAGLDVGLAVEEFGESRESLDILRHAKFKFVKLAADSLLDKGSRKAAHKGSDLIDMIAEADMEIIATDVASDEDAVSLIDMGIDLMTGARLSPPRRIKDGGQGPLSA